VKFLVDAQLPARLSRLLSDNGHDALHCSDMPRGNRSTDAEIAAVADAEDRVVISKDRDFRDTHLLQGVPHRLLAVMTGNITNADLLALFDTNLKSIVAALEEVQFVELGPTSLVIHDDRPPS
jgi:predicted nuclease of predicted toxin-antitoxin system